MCLCFKSSKQTSNLRAFGLNVKRYTFLCACVCVLACVFVKFLTRVCVCVQGMEKIKNEEEKKSIIIAYSKLYRGNRNQIIISTKNKLACLFVSQI